MNDAPVFSINPTQLEVDEDFSGIREVAVFPQSQPPNEQNQQITWRIQGEAEHVNLSINAGTGRVTATSKFGAFGADTVFIIADDGQSFNNTSSRMLIIKVRQQNNRPNSLALENQTIEENAPIGTAIGRILGTDIDTNDTLSYALAEGLGDIYNDLFYVSGDTLYADTVFNYEQKDEYNVRLKVMDNEGGTFEDIFSIRIQDVNDVPASVVINKSSIQENNPLGTQIGRFFISDEDFEDTQVVRLLNADSSLFVIENNRLFASTALNYEDSTQYTLVIEVTDEAGGVLSDTLVIDIGDINDPPSEILSENALVISENAPVNTRITSFSLVDEDQPEGGEETYTLRGNPPFLLRGNELYLTQPLNFEQAKTITFTLRATDQLGAPIFRDFQITVLDANDEPTDLSISHNTLSENAVLGTTVGTFSTEDEDENDTHSYTILDTLDATRFSITDDVLKSNAPFNFEEKSTYQIFVRTDDKKGGTLDRLVTVLIEDANDAPTDIALSSTEVVENKEAGTLVAQLSGVDEDAEETLTYALISQENQTLPFVIEGDKLLTTEVFNFEERGEYVIKIQATDSQSASVQKEVIINIIDENEEHRIGEIAALLMNEGTSVSIPITITDEDNASQSSLNVVAVSENASILPPEALTTTFDNGQWVLTIDAAEVTSGVSTVRVEANDALYQKSTSFEVTINAKPNILPNAIVNGCEGDSILVFPFSDFVSDEPGKLSYQINSANVIASGESFTSFQIDNEAETLIINNAAQLDSILFQFAVADTLGAREGGAFLYVLNPVPAIAFEVAETGCLGGAHTFTISESVTLDSFASWEWRFEDSTFTNLNAATVEHQFDSAGVYQVVLKGITSAGCESIAALAVVINDLPTVMQNGNRLTVAAENGETVQWFIDGEPIPAEEGGQDATHKINALGIFYAEVTNASGCMVRSDSVDLFVTNIADDFEEIQDIIQLFPNPTSEQLHVALSSKYIGEVILTIFDPTGKQIRQMEMQKNQQEMEEKIDVEHLTSGTYILQILQGERVENRRFAVQ